MLYQLTAIKGRGSTIQSISSQLQQLELQLQTTRHVIFKIIFAPVYFVSAQLSQLSRFFLLIVNKIIQYPLMVK